MTDKDKKAFENWELDVEWSTAFTSHRLAAVDAWQAAIEYERARLQKSIKLEKVPCDCHLFKQQVCDFCQGLIMYAHITSEDKG